MFLNLENVPYGFLASEGDEEGGDPPEAFRVLYFVAHEEPIGSVSMRSFSFLTFGLPLTRAIFVPRRPKHPGAK